MFQQIPKIVAFLSLAYEVICDQSTLSSCGAEPHGSIVYQGRYFYKCNNGQLEPQGCIDASGSKVGIGETFHLNVNYQMRCKQSSDGFMTTEYDACIIQGKVISPGGIYENGKHWFSCSREGSFVVEKLAGCMQDGKRLARGERVQLGDAVLECRETETFPEMMAVGCAENGKEYNLGEVFADDRFFYACSTGSSGKPKKETYGCVKGQERLYGWQTYVENGVVFRCEVRKSKPARHAVIGCFDKENSQQRKLGCHWTAGSAPYRYTMTCDQTGPTEVVQTRVSCVYGDAGQNGEKGFLVEPGCYRIIDGHGVGCRNTTGADVEFVRFQPSNVDVAIAENNLQLC